MRNSGRNKRRLLFVAFGVFMAAAMAACATEAADRATVDSSATGTAAPQQEPASGIKGKVLRGPVVGGPIVGEEPADAPFAATFHVTDRQGNEMVQFRSDDEGAFEVHIAPGDYLIVPDDTAPVITPAQQQQAVTVPDGEMVEVTLRFDTGIR